MENSIKSNFNFKISPTVANDNFEPVKTISFQFNPELLQDFSATHPESVVYEIFAEKVKQDLITFLNKIK